MRHARIVAAIAVVVMALGACSGDEPDARQSPSPSPTGSTPGSTPTPPTASLDVGSIKIRLRAFAGGFDQPVFLTHAGDGTGRVFVADQSGRVSVLDRNGDRIGTFLEISSRVQSGGERGLLGLAFHPDYESNGRFFVYYSNNAGDNVVSRFQRRSANAADPGSERVILRMDDPFSNHNGGWIAFGRDGFLYIATGDGGSAGDPLDNAQSLRSLLGKILRIDVNSGSPYGIPDDNPFVGRSGARREIWAYGLRNPWRNSFDRASQDLYIGDVGQGAREEVNAEPASSDGGVNYGWNTMEGSRCYQGSSCDRSGLKRPFAEYPTGQGCAVTGGYVYRGSAFPQLVGAYFFGDYCNGRIFAVDSRRALRGEVSARRLLDTGLLLSSFGEDEAGELYVIGHGGTVHRLLAA
jgi:glucose/arabinose dehydrogenase